MADHLKMYSTLFKAQTKAIELQEEATAILKKAQQDTEEMYISAPDPKIHLFETIKPDEKPEKE